jgi:hypothetical protein
MKKNHTVVPGLKHGLLAAIVALSVASVPACGSDTSTEGSGGGTGKPSGGATGSGGVAGSPGGGSGGKGTGGAVVTPSGGSGGNASGGTTAKASGGSGGSGTGGAAGSSGADAGGTSSDGSASRADAARTDGAGGGTSTGGATGAAGSSTKLDAALVGGSTGTGGSSMGDGGSTGDGGVAGIPLPCEILNTTPNKCVSAHSTVRVIVPGYAGPLYQLCKGTASAGPASCKGTAQDVAAKDGYADATAHDTFCSGGSCTITKIYDQSGMKNDLEPAPKGGAKNSPDNPANAGDLKVTINGHAAYGILIKTGIGYRAGCSGCTSKTGNGMVTGDEPESMYWITSQKDLIDGCCFDYGNAETTSNDDGNGTMEALYFGGNVSWGSGAGGKPGPWLMADLENGLFAGWENKQDQNISTNTPLKFDFVAGVLLGDTRDKNSGKGRFALYGGDATTGTLKTLYDGIRPEKTGYVPMVKQGSIVLGIGGDNSNAAGGRFYEGAVATGTVLSKAAVDALQAALVAARYGK